MNKWIVGLVALCTNASVFAETLLQGEMIQGALVRGQTTPNSVVHLDDQQLQVSEQGYFVFGFDRDSKSNHQLVIEHPDGEVETIALDVESRDYQKQVIEGIAQRIMQPSEEDIARASDNAQMVHQARNQFSDRNDYRADFQWPALGRISGVYGSQRIYNGVPGRPHFGVDVANPTGSPVVAPANGVVTVADADMFYSGGTIIIDHGYGVSSSYLHLSKLSVEVGEEVSAGDKIGEIGATGRVTGPHLDWRLNWFQLRLDPQLIVPPMKQAIAEAKKQQ
ncbi:M23 family metallopeptidase [Paraferrimonas haliotis]|uniref:Periplasmic metalloprotease M23B family protein n=1 Tax=Paraferrimonas haliotis TaxID=2013866 RepID=A0AA37WYB1_9GAMM|nr:M23 family metallopeptidase [Paraferrimonas haliotis]GLS84349.1 periplasmic metalloprotease M23B family protein [Paraferrimonas haliotis]